MRHHGPGEAVRGPVLRLRAWRLGARGYVEALEDAMIAVAGAAGAAGAGVGGARAGAAGAVTWRRRVRRG